MSFFLLYYVHESNYYVDVCLRCIGVSYIYSKVENELLA